MATLSSTPMACAPERICAAGPVCAVPRSSGIASAGALPSPATTRKPSESLGKPSSQRKPDNHKQLLLHTRGTIAQADGRLRVGLRGQCGARWQTTFTSSSRGSMRAAARPNTAAGDHAADPGITAMVRDRHTMNE